MTKETRAHLAKTADRLDREITLRCSARPKTIRNLQQSRLQVELLLEKVKQSSCTQHDCSSDGARAFLTVMFLHSRDGVVATQAVLTFRPAIPAGDMPTLPYGPVCTDNLKSVPGILLPVY